MYTANKEIDTLKYHKIFCSYYFILCVEQLFSIFYIFNYISFYRKHPLNNLFFILFNLVIILYLVILMTLNSSNFKYDFFKITYFEFNENLMDSFDDNNRLKCFRICFYDFFSCYFYTKIVYCIFDKLAKKKKSK